MPSVFKRSMAVAILSLLTIGGPLSVFAADPVSAPTSEATSATPHDHSGSGTASASDHSGTRPVDGILPHGTIPPPTSSFTTDSSGTFPTAPSATPNTTLNPTVDQATGMMTEHYDFALPPARGQVLPSLAVDYNSGLQNNDSIIGYGWQLNFPRIERIDRNGSNRFLISGNEFASSFSGELANASGTNYVPKVGKPDAMTYVYSYSIWTATDSTGTTYVFGATAGARQDSSTDATRIAKWMISSITDKHGNTTTYTYTKSNGQIYPATITYSGNGSTAGTNVVTFGLTAASHPFLSYATGFAVTTSYQVSTITASVSGVTKRQYSLSYATGSNGNRAVLHGITNSATSDSGTVTTLPATTFTYQSASTGWSVATSYSVPTATTDGTGAGNGYSFGSNAFVRDVNGDGLPDIVAMSNTAMSGNAYSDIYNRVYINTGSGYSLASWTMPTTTASGEGSGGYGYTIGVNAQFADVNADGLTDIVAMDFASMSGNPSADTANRVFLNTGSSWRLSTTWTMPSSTASGTGSGGWGYLMTYTQLQDVNGDGLLDVVTMQNSSMVGSPSSDLYDRVFLNTTSGWTLSTTWTMPTRTTSGTGSGSGYSLGSEAAMVDVNADGLPDVVAISNVAMTGSPATDTGNRVFLNSGHGFTLSTSWTMPTNSATGTGAGSGYTYGLNVQIQDINADGLPDVVIMLGTTLTGVAATDIFNRVFLNTGSGWSMSSSWTMPSTGGSSPSGYQLTTAELHDVNDDGLLDVVVMTNDTMTGSPGGDMYNRVLLNTGSGWTTSTTWLMPKTTASGTGYGYSIESVAQLHDINHDGLLDVIALNNVSMTGVPSTDTYNRVFTASGSSSDKLSAVSMSSGASASISYSEKAILDKNIFNETPSILAVSSVSSNDGFGHTSSNSFSYGTGLYYYANYSSRSYKKFAGFASVTLTDALGNTHKNYYHQGNAQDAASHEPTESEAHIGLSYLNEERNASGTLTRSTLTRWDETAENGASMIAPALIIVMVYNSDGSTHTDTATSFTYTAPNSAYLSSWYVYEESAKTEYGTVTAAADYSYTDTGTDKRTTTTTYAIQAPTDYTVNNFRPASVTVTDYSGVTVAQQQFLYDSLASGFVSNGDVTTAQQWISGSTYASTTHTYDAYGNLLTTTAPNGGTTTVTYDTVAHQYPTTVIGALGHSTTSAYSLATGKPTSMTSPNGAIITTYYDGFGRPLTEQQSSDATASTMVTTKIWTYNDTGTSSAPRYVTVKSYFSATAYAQATTFLDGFDRPIETKSLNAAGTGYNETQTTYDSLGRPATSSLPAAATTSTYDSTALSSTLFQTLGYDALNRVTSVADAIGTTTTSYSGLTKTVTDARSKQKSYTTDGLGRLTAVVENISGTAYTTTYTYTGADKLASITDSMGNVRAFTYDGRGLRLTAQDLHASADTTFGTWTYTYDTSGNMATSLSPNAITTTYGYDLLNRPTTEDASSTAGTEITYTYDSCTHGTGLLCSTSVNGGASTSKIYTANGRAASETKTISAVAYTTSYTYDYASNPLTITYPDGTIVTNTYNVIGSLSTVQKKVSSDASAVTVSSGMTYGPDGQITAQTNANGTSTSWTYDSTKRYRLTNKHTIGPVSSSTTTTTVYFTSLAGDGYTYYGASDWASAHSATTGSYADSSTGTTTIQTGKDVPSPSYYNICRGYYPFDTSALPDDATITAASLNLVVSNKYDVNNDGTDFMTIVQSTQASTSSLSTSDYSLDGAISSPTEGNDSTNRKDITAITIGGSLSIPLNSTGISWISKTSSTKLGLREGHDVINSSSGVTAGAFNTVTTYTSEATTASQRPTLSITYTQTTSATAPILQDLSYTYDAVNNIATIIDASAQTTAKTTTYTYDDLSRLTNEAVSGAANGDNTSIAYTYNAIGDLTYRSDKGTYTYAGNTGTSYANPHAVTSILKTDGTTQTFTYDNNGNVTSDGTTPYAWDWRNRMTSSGTTTSSTSTTMLFNSSAGDGFTYRGDTSWANTHDTTTGSSADYLSATTTVQTGKDVPSPSYYNICRGYYPFDTSALPDDVTITAASLNLVVSNKYDVNNDGTDFMTIVQSTQASTSSLSASDYGLDGAVSTAPAEGNDSTNRKDITAITIGGALAIPLNSTGQSWISKTGYTKLGMREGHDVINSSSGVTAGAFNTVTTYTSESATATQRPTLSVTYTAPATTATTYTYDAGDNRVTKGGSSTTIYPSPGYRVEGTTSTVYLGGGDGNALAEIANVGTTSTISTLATDHLGSTALTTNSSGTVNQLLDYHGFGNTRISSGTTSEKKTFIGQYSDTETSLSYLNARYYDAGRGQFLSEDPMFWDIGESNDGLKMLLDPQWVNSYSYAVDNPITLRDSTGKEPVKKYVGTMDDFVALLNNSPSKVGLYTGSKAASYMKQLGTTEWSWSNPRPMPAQTAYFNTKVGRYIYTEKGGWIDMVHFLFYAGKAYNYKQSGSLTPAADALKDGYWQEFTDRFFAPYSAYSYEDLPSDKYGADFAVFHFNSDNGLSFAEQVEAYLRDVLKATDPTKAPNYQSLPATDSTNPATATNHSTTPIYISP